jgi:hypothetical protein
MACAKCSFYQPKESTAAFLVEGKNNLLRMRQEIPVGGELLFRQPHASDAARSLEDRELVTKREDLRLQGSTGSKTGG